MKAWYTRKLIKNTLRRLARSYKNLTFDLHLKSIDWFLYDWNFGHYWVGYVKFLDGLIHSNGFLKLDESLTYLDFVFLKSRNCRKP